MMNLSAKQQNKNTQKFKKIYLLIIKPFFFKQTEFFFLALFTEVATDETDTQTRQLAVLKLL